MEIHELNTKALTDPAYVPFDDGTDTYKAEFNEVVEDAANAAVAEADLTNNPVAFTSGDAASPTAWSDVSVITTGSTLATLFNRISTMVKNVRWLYSKLGTTDISSIGGGTVTGAISALNGNISNLIYVQDYTVPQLTLTSGTPGTRGSQVQLDVTKSGYTPLLVRLTQVSDSTLANVVPFFGSPSLPNTVYVNAYRASGSSGTITANVRVVYLKN